MTFTFARLTPELLVTDLARSLHFRVELIGFRVAFDRPRAWGSGRWAWGKIFGTLARDRAEAAPALQGRDSGTGVPRRM
ncbi:hypothetical protein [Methylobacterium sp. DB0501]|uniref:hypothetical protein n=1 Tax=Methylobacterium sp. DB0501 TaxID=2709665 RepID=UPI0019D0C7E9|nr:hypothetical protein [Methylobacterium sp. DB0501]